MSLALGSVGSTGIQSPRMTSSAGPAPARDGPAASALASRGGGAVLVQSAGEPFGGSGRTDKEVIKDGEEVVVRAVGRVEGIPGWATQRDVELSCVALCLVVLEYQTPIPGYPFNRHRPAGPGEPVKDPNPPLLLI